MSLSTGVLMLWRGHISHIIKMHYFFNNLHLYSRAWFKQTRCIVIMTKEESIKIINFMTPRIGVLGLRCEHLSQMLEMRYFFQNLLLYSQAQIRQIEI